MSTVLDILITGAVLFLVYLFVGLYLKAMKKRFWWPWKDTSKEATDKRFGK